ncbi:hypothetical protein HMPREF0556_10331 [Listeria grayi DSM 20601]|uniref:Uncharacterized protein n=1 Tax=Listeria grayi DSM 20601 TaxID=525367 RepID=D7UV56_LISGR|nr:hypothetical protein HMPREF0556_10331 [Listeria grayi DSM 20601]
MSISKTCFLAGQILQESTFFHCFMVSRGECFKKTKYPNKSLSPKRFISMCKTDILIDRGGEKLA